MSRCTMDDQSIESPWLCHICEQGFKGESTACSLCYMTTCHAHLRKLPLQDPATGLYVLQPVCLWCAADKLQ